MISAPSVKATHAFDEETPPLIVDFRPIVDMSDEQFLLFCSVNHPLRFERKATGEIVIMAPEGGETGSRYLEIGVSLRLWAKEEGRGVAFGASTGFILPDRAIYSPDAAWVRKDRLSALTQEQKEKFLPLCPDFVVELRSPSDRLRDVQGKMLEYIANGALLGWLIDPRNRAVHIYRPNQPAVHLHDPESVSGEPELPRFLLQMAAIWDTGF